MAAQRFEQHIQYADTSYLTFEFGQETIVLELIDPGTVSAKRMEGFWT
jgi:hypothetical protein